jgi:hypothetical protein
MAADDPTMEWWQILLGVLAWLIGVYGIGKAMNGD